MNASNVVDAQAAYEVAMAVWGAIMGGVNLLYQGAGWLEGGLTASYEKLILDAEILQMMAEFFQPIDRRRGHAWGSTRWREVGPGGHHFGTAHTMERYETAFYRPLLSDWRNFETWQEDGAWTATERANRIWKQLLAEARAAGPRSRRGEALDAYVARRARRSRLALDRQVTSPRGERAATCGSCARSPTFCLRFIRRSGNGGTLAAAGEPTGRARRHLFTRCERQDEMRWKALAAVALLVIGAGAVLWAITGGPGAASSDGTQYLTSEADPGRRGGRPSSPRAASPEARPMPWPSARRRPRSPTEPPMGRAAAAPGT